MTALPWYFDVLSPFAYLQWRWLKRDWPEVALQPVPVLLGVILTRIGQLGPAEIPGKREFTYRYVHWRAQELGFALQFPAVHPFNPLSALRLIIASGSTEAATDRVLNHIWSGGAADGEALAELAAELGVSVERLADPGVKDALKHNTESALARGVFGVPTLDVAGQLFFGQDATPFAMAVHRDPAILQRPPFDQIGAITIGVQRAR